MPPHMLAAMIFILLLVMMVGGFILLFPLTRRLGAFLEHRLQSKRPEEIDPSEIAEMRQAIRSMRQELNQLLERQAFTEALLEERKPDLLGLPDEAVRSSSNRTSL